MEWPYLKKNLLLLCMSILVCVGGAECVLRAGGYYMPPPDPPPCVYHAPNCALYEASATFGYHLKPSRRTTYRYPLLADFGRELSMNSNRHGFRNNREFEEADKRVRILVTGDSQAFGEGVEEAERFSNLVETDEPGWRVDNLAMPGYGPDLMLRAYEQVRRNPRQDVVLLAFFSDDFHRMYPYYAGIGFRIPHYVKRGGRLENQPPSALNFFSRMRLWQAYVQVSWTLEGGELGVTEAVLDRFRELSREDSFRLAVLMVPTKRPSDFERSEIAWLAEYCRRNAVAYRDASTALAREGYMDLLIRQNSHFNPRGHRVIAGEMRQLLKGAVTNEVTQRGGGVQ